jgi:hypothetical protein
MITLIMSFLAGALLGSMFMGIYAAFVGARDAHDDW